MKIVTVVGARPQFIKAFAVSSVLHGRHDEVMVHTGQHYDTNLSSVFFEELDIPPPAYNLGAGSGSHGRQTARMIPGIEEIVETEDPDAVITYGDTNSTLASAVAVSKMTPELAHVEAGLRSYDREIPEEVNRVLTDHAADLLFAPSETAVENLRREGIDTGVYNTGDVMYDTLLWARDRATDHTNILADLDLQVGTYVLATVHRARNTDNEDRLTEIIEGLAGIPDPIVLPLHPRTETRLREFGLYDRLADAVQLIDPVGYLEFIRLLDAAARVGTDSGGVQKEAFFLDTPCVTFREGTEWVETVDCGWNVLVGADAEAIRRELTRSDRPTDKPHLYGDGNAADRIVEVLEDG